MDRAQIIAQARRVVLKVGSGVLTTLGALDRRRVHVLADQVSRLAAGGRQVILVSSGAVAAGMAKAGLKRRPRTMHEKQAAASLGQAGLMQAYEDAFEARGHKVSQLLLTAADLTNRARQQNVKNTLFTLLDWDVIPIINENDPVSPSELRFGDNDNLASMLTNLLGAELLIILTNVDGLLDADPRENPRAKRISLVEQVNADLLGAASTQPDTTGMGGIVSKVRAADKAARAGAHTIVANGLLDDILDRLAAGEDLGTLFLPRVHALSSKKHWIAFTAIHHGEIVVDEGAVKPIVEGGKSLLAAGVVEVRGSFQEGEAVRVLGPGNCILGVGLVNYGSDQMEAIKGLKSSQIVNNQTNREPGEVIHRDNFAVFDLGEEESLACLMNT